MANSKIDNNFQGTGIAVEDDATGAIQPLLVDPVTGRLLVVITYESSGGVLNASKIDENYEGVALAVTDDASANVRPLLIHATSGNLLVDIT